jgi:spermidine synthase
MNAVVLLLFLVSGACGLIYEVAWSRLMTQIFGTTALAVGVVLAAFMSGLAAGSYFLGKRGDRSPNPLRLYAFYEIGIAVTALGSLFVIDRMVPLYLWAYPFFGESEVLLAGIRFAVAFTVILIPTILMGATLPILSRFIMRGLSTVGRQLSSLYAINTFGAVAGGVLAGFYLIGTLGIHPTIYIAVGGNLGIGLLAWLASRFTGELRQAAPEPAAGAAAVARPDGAGPGREQVRLLLWAIALSGLTSFAYEVLWTRGLVFLLGNSTYAFTMMLTAFLAGIALGGYLIRFIADRTGGPVTIFAWLEIFIGLTSAAALPLLFSIAYSPAVRGFLARMSEQLGPLMLSRFGASLLVMLIPATLIGATFPLVGKICVTDLRQTGREVGTVYAVNTAGNVLGALLPAFIILPLLGIQKGVVLMGALNVCVGGTVLLSQRKRLPGLRYAAPIGAVGIAVLLMSVPLDYQFPSEFQTDRHRVLFYREGPLATTKVFLDPETQVKHMSVDGIVIGGSGIMDYKQQLLAHLPKLLLRRYESELSVGLGSGILVAESLRHDMLKRIVCVEIEPSVVEGADYFEEETYGLLADPRVSVVVDDVANFLRTTPEKYDIVSADEKTAEKYASNGFSHGSADLHRHLPARVALVLPTGGEGWPE